MKKRTFLVLCMMISLFAFSFTSFAASAASEEEKQMIDSAKQLVTELTSMDLSQVYDPEQENEQADALFGSWYQLKNEVGEFVSFGDDKTIKVTQPEKGQYLVVLTAECKNAKVTFHVTLDINNQGVKSITADKVLSLGEKMKDAVLNTIMGMGTVFIVLIFISFIISLFKYIPNLLNSYQNKQQAVLSNTEQPEIPVTVQNNDDAIQEEELADDAELAAVITAAIMASMGDNYSEDGFVVRSIKKRRTKNWQNA